MDEFLAEPLGIAFLGMGFQPKWRREDTEWMPKGRYRIMREYMQKTGTLGVDMMTRTCTVQVNMDFSDEADMVRKFRTSLALQPIATALFANSPFTDGAPNGFLSFRSHVWEDTDPDRTGMLPFVFDGDMGFEKYTDYMLDVPMYFVYREGRYIDASGQSFRDFLAGRLPALPGEKPGLQDWEDHLTTAFPDLHRPLKLIYLNGEFYREDNRRAFTDAFTFFDGLGGMCSSSPTLRGTAYRNISKNREGSRISPRNR